MAAPPPPTIEINGKLVRTWSVSDKPPARRLPDKRYPDPDEAYDSLDLLLRSYAITHVDGERDFWPYKVLKKVLTRGRVLHELMGNPKCARVKPGDLEKWSHQIVPGHLSDKLEPWRVNGGASSSRRKEGMIAIFAILLLRGKADLIDIFISGGITDHDLPLSKKKDPKTKEWCLLLPGSKKDTIRGFPHGRQAEPFYDKQWSFVVPHLNQGHGGSVVHNNFDPRTVLPWVELEEEPVSDEDDPGYKVGGGGVVALFKVDEDSHTLEELKSTKGVIAIKTLTKQEFKDAKQEIAMLERFSGKAHPHLVTLLTTFTFEGYHNLVFPAAKGDLDEFMNRYYGPTLTDKDFMRWVSKQILGLCDAMNHIHNPPREMLKPGEKPNGRHGDLKPENLLWFQPEAHERGYLVISDFGLTTVNSDKSRSNVPNKNIPNTPGYRPPECDIKNGKISRAFDVWTMGCLMLEIVTWLLGGRDGLARSRTGRLKKYITGANTDIFFDIHENPRAVNNPTYKYRHIFTVKDSVVKQMEEMHGKSGCSPYLHELLELIHNDMMIVPHKERITSKKLVERVRSMDDMARSSSGGRAYLTGGDPRRNYKIKNIAHEANPNEMAQDLLAVLRQRLGRAALDAYDGALDHTTQQMDHYAHDDDEY